MMAFRGHRHSYMPSLSSLITAPGLFFIILPFFIFLVSFPAPASAVGSAVIGIDVGTEYLKAALVKPGIPFDIVLTKDSKRKEAATVGFKPTGESGVPFPERYYGGGALALAARYPDDVYSNLKILLGIPFDDGDNDVVKTFKARYPSLNVESAPGGRGSVAIRSNRLGEAEKKDAFLVEELLAMQLKQIKENADAMAGKGSDIRDAVITYPSFYTAEEKRSLELAAYLAGLNVDALVSDGLAVGLNYATSRTFPSVSDGQKPQYHVIYDMGAGSTTASVLRFQDRTVTHVGRLNKTVHEVQVLGTGWDRTLGGDSLNDVIVNDMVNKFVEDKRVRDRISSETVKSHGRTMAKLWRDAEKVRQILSANSETSTGFESFYEEDLNFRYKITRSEFEKLASDHAARVTKPLEQAIASSGISLDDIDSIILHGGAIRTPFVQRELEKACGISSKVRTNVNADEAAVFGASFKGASLSPSFRVKDIRAADEAAYPVLLKWTTDGKVRSQKLFIPTSQVGPEKRVTLKNKEDFELEFYQQISSGDGTTESPVLSIGTKNLTASVSQLKNKFGCADANVTTNFSIRLSPVDGLPEVVSASVECEVENPDKKGIVEDVKDFFGFGSKKDGQAPLGENAEPGESTTLDGEGTSTPADSTTTSTTSSSSASSASTSSAAATAAGGKKEAASETKVEIIPIAFTSSPLGTPALSPSELSRIQNRLAAFDTSDRDRILREEALNELESFIYRTRDWVEDEEFTKTLKEDQLSLLKERVAAAGDWLYGDGTEAKTADFQQKLKSLKEIVNPALKRRNENSERPARVQQLQDLLGSARTISEIMRKQVNDDEASYSSSISASISQTSTPEPSSSSSASSSDPLDELDDDPYSTSSSASATPAASKPAGPKYNVFHPSDLSALENTYETTRKWLETKLASQEKLGESDDPALTTADIEAQAGQLDRTLSKVYEKLSAKGRRSGGGGGGRKPKSSKKGKGEKAKDQKQPPKEEAPRKDEL